MQEDKDKKYMGMAIRLAKKAQNPSPNPYVGAILVKNNKIVGRGFHRCAGESHAEVNAIHNAGILADGSTLYINLEPCVHYGKTPPCTDVLIGAGIKEVIIGIKDPNPLVNGKGIKKLQDAGIKVKVGILEDQAKKLNEMYLKYITTKEPFVILKSAESLDGKIATKTGDSKWISCEESRQYGHKLRGKIDAILVGINTVLKDNPELKIVGQGFSLAYATPKGLLYKVPYKVIVDSKLRIPLEAKILKNPEQVILATTKKASKTKIKKLRGCGVNVLIISEKKGKVNLKVLMKELAKMEISSVLIEGGGEINASAIESGIVDKILFFIAPKIIGGRDAVTSVEGDGIKNISQAMSIKNMTVKQSGEDFLIEGYIKLEER